VALVVALLDEGGAGVAEVAPSDLLAQLVLGPEVLPEAKRLIQGPLRLGGPVRAASAGPRGSFLRYGPLLGLPPAEPLGERGLDVLGRGGRREGALEEPPGRGPRRRHPRRQRAGSAGGVGAGPGGAGRLVHRRGRSGLAAPRCSRMLRRRRLGRCAVGRQRGGRRDDPDVVVVGPRRGAARLPVALAHRGPPAEAELVGLGFGFGAAIAREREGRRSRVVGNGMEWTKREGGGRRGDRQTDRAGVRYFSLLTSREGGRREKGRGMEEATVNSRVPRGLNRKKVLLLLLCAYCTARGKAKTKRLFSNHRSCAA
jgi:hypothetical protein